MTRYSPPQTVGDDAHPDAIEPYDLAVLIGRFAPFHEGHYSIVKAALTGAKYLLIVIGSANSPRSPFLPFTNAEREQIIRNALTPEETARVMIRFVEDRTYNEEAWIASVHKAAASALQEAFGDTTDRSITLIGHEKDESSYYLKRFPSWDAISVENYRDLHATRIRSAYFSNAAEAFLNDIDGHRKGDTVRDRIVHPNTRMFLFDFMQTDAYRYVRDWIEFDTKYHAKFAGLDYPVQFLTVDAVVVKAAHVLLVKRRSHPGKGLWALPGGHLKTTETVVDGIIRELIEETKIKVPEGDLRKLLKEVRYFDPPKRSTRGRTVTFAGLIHLPMDQEDLPWVKGADDAEKAKWVPLSLINREQIFEDHADIVAAMTANL